VILGGEKRDNDKRDEAISTITQKKKENNIRIPFGKVGSTLKKKQPKGQVREGPVQKKKKRGVEFVEKTWQKQTSTATSTKIGQGRGQEEKKKLSGIRQQGNTLDRKNKIQF